MSDKKNTVLSQLLSPATGLAILGTAAFAFSLYRAGQLSHLVIRKEAPSTVSTVTESTSSTIAQNQSQNRSGNVNVSGKAEKTKIDFDSIDLIKFVDNSEATNLAKSGLYPQAVEKANKELKNNPDYLPNIAMAGDILSQYGDKNEGLDLLAKATSMAPNNQYLALRHALRLAQNGRFTLAKRELLPLVNKYPEWKEPHFLLSKVHFKKDNLDLSLQELDILTKKPDLTSREAEESGLLLGKLGHIDEGYRIFQQAIIGKSDDRFYTSYCEEWLQKYPHAYENALAEIKDKLSSTSEELTSMAKTKLQIQEIALLLLLGHNDEAEKLLKQAVTEEPDNSDLQALLATTGIVLGHANEAKNAFQAAAINYEPQF